MNQLTAQLARTTLTDHPKPVFNEQGILVNDENANSTAEKVNRLNIFKQEEVLVDHYRLNLGHGNKDAKYIVVQAEKGDCSIIVIMNASLYMTLVIKHMFLTFKTAYMIYREKQILK